MIRKQVMKTFEICKNEDKELLSLLAREYFAKRKRVKAG